MSSVYPDTWQALRGAWLNAQGVMICQQSDQTAQIVYGSTGWATQQVKATVLWSAGAAGLILRYDNTSKQYYSLTAYAQSGIVAMEYVNSALNRSTLASYSGLIGINMAQDFQLIADANGSNLRGWVNDIKYLDLTNSALSAGQIGLEYQVGQGLFRDIHVQTNLPDGNIAPVTLPTDFGAYCSCDDVKSLLTGIPTGDIATDDDVYSYIKEASDKINRATYTSFGRGIQVEERYDGTGQFTLILDHSPIIKLYNLQIYNFNNTLIRSFTAADAENTGTLIVEKNYGLVTIPPNMTTPSLVTATPTMWPTINPLAPSVPSGTEYDYFNRFGRGVRNVVVSYSYGFETVPEVIRWACAKLAAIMLLIKRGNKDTGGAVILQMEGLTVNMLHRQGLSAAYGSVIDKWAQDIENDLKLYRRMPVKIM